MPECAWRQAHDDRSKCLSQVQCGAAQRRDGYDREDDARKTPRHENMPERYDPADPPM